MPVDIEMREKIHIMKLSHNALRPVWLLLTFFSGLSAVDKTEKF